MLALIALCSCSGLLMVLSNRRQRSKALKQFVNEPGRGRGDLLQLFNFFITLLRSIRWRSPIVWGDNGIEVVVRKNASPALFSRDEVERGFGQDSWQRQAYESLKATLLARDKTFPCVYATMGFRGFEHRYVFLESHNVASPQNLRIIGPALRQYLSLARSLGDNTSLVIMGKPSRTERELAEYNKNFWELLRGLRTIDEKPWPESVPTQTQNAHWTFCFDGEPVFLVSLTPAHVQRRSRHSSVPLIALQPKWALDRLLATPEKREAAQNKVRKLLAEYDSIGISPDLTSYGTEGTSEVRQLCLLDENTPVEVPYADFDA